jgi:hypothetical protein
MPTNQTHMEANSIKSNLLRIKYLCLLFSQALYNFQCIITVGYYRS